MRLVYNQRQYYNQGAATIVSAAAVYDATYKEVQVQKNGHGLQVGDSIVLQCSPSMFSGTYSVAQILDADNFTVGKDGGAEFTQNLSSVTYQQVDTENIFAVIDALRKMEMEDPDTGQPRGDTISGIVIRNPTLKYSSTECAAELANIKTIDYGFSTNRGFPTYEVVVKVEARRVRGRRPFNS